MYIGTSLRPKKIDPTTLWWYFGWVLGRVGSRRVYTAILTWRDDYRILTSNFSPVSRYFFNELHFGLIEEVMGEMDKEEEEG